MIQPSVVVTLGSLALRVVTGRSEPLRELRGTALHAHVLGRDMVVWPTVHPGAVVAAPSLAPILRADAAGLAALIHGARVAAPRAAIAAGDPAAGEPDTSEAQSQLSFDVRGDS
jgi:hypothetical protein